MPSAPIPTLIKSAPEQQLRLRPERKQFIENLIVASCFAICLLVFFSVSVFKCFSRKQVLNENREAAKLPKLRCTWSSISSFPHSFEDYFVDRIAFRDRLVSARTLLYLKLFRVSGSSQVIIGKNGFLFYADELNRPMIMGSQPFSLKEMRGWKNLLERRHRWCKERGIDYFFLLAPTKSSIYPDLLPNEYANCSRQTRTDQLIDFLRQTHSPVQVLDLRPALRAARGPSPLYLQTDTHWNPLGAYYGYKSMIELLRARHPVIPAPSRLSEFDVQPYHFATGDLARMQGILGMLTESNIVVNDKDPSATPLFRDSNFTENELGLGDTKAFGFHQDRNDLPSMVMFRDSFACYMIDPYLPKHFSRTVYFWQADFSKSLVLREKPDIVAQEVLESCLYCKMPDM